MDTNPFGWARRVLRLARILHREGDTAAIADVFGEYSGFSGINS